MNTSARSWKQKHGYQTNYFFVMIMSSPVISILYSFHLLQVVLHKPSEIFWEKMGFCLIHIPMNTGYTVFIKVPSLNGMYLLFSFCHPIYVLLD